MDITSATVAVPLAFIATHLIAVGVWYFKKLHAVETSLATKADTQTLNLVVDSVRRRNEENADRILHSMTQLEARITDRQQELLTALINEARSRKT